MATSPKSKRDSEWHMTCEEDELPKLEDVTIGSPSKSRVRKNLDPSQPSWARRLVVTTCSLVFLASGILIAVGVVTMSPSDSGNQSNSNAVHKFNNTDLANFNYTECKEQWVFDISVAEEEESDTIEPRCSSFRTSQVCERTVNCCWIPGPGACGTFQGQPECSDLHDRENCEINSFCLWRPVLNKCVRGFKPVTEIECSAKWDPAKLLSFLPCSFFTKRNACSSQVGCCWHDNLGTGSGFCGTFGNSPECGTLKTYSDCEMSSGVCTWDESKSKCSRGNPPDSTTLSPSISGSLRKKTNFVIVLADDLGYGDVGYNGGRARTPYLDAFSRARSSLRFDSMHTTPVCSPSRCMLLSGQNPERNCVSGARIDETFKTRMSMTTIADDAKSAGYKTFMAGKWHLSRLDDDAIGKRGFDEWTASYGNMISYDSRCLCNEVECKASPLRTCPTKPGCYLFGTRFCSALSSQQCFLGSFTLEHDIIPDAPLAFSCDLVRPSLDRKSNIPAGIPNNTMYCDFIVNEFQRFVSNLDLNIPFLAYIAFSEPHMVYVADPAKRVESERFHRVATNSRLANYLSVVESVDTAFGNIKLILERTNRVDDTLLLFASDNGPEVSSQGGAGSALPLRGWKRTLYEGGIRIPSVLSWPRYITRNMRITSVTALSDIRPTLRDIIKRENPRVVFDSEPQDGESLLPLLSNPRVSWSRTKSYLVCMPVFDSTSMRCSSYAYIEGTKKLILRRNNERDASSSQLFDFSVDLSEQINLVHSQKATYQAMASRAKASVAELMQARSNNC